MSYDTSLADLQGAIYTDLGWLELNEGPYRLSDETYAKLETRIRRTTASSPFLEGDWLVQGVRENETFDLVVRIRSTDQKPCWVAIQALRSALLQRRWALRLVLGTYEIQHTCFMADHTVEMNKPMLYASQGLVKAQIQAIPNVGGFAELGGVGPRSIGDVANPFDNA